jgi:hypothetical protein
MRSSGKARPGVYLHLRAHRETRPLPSAGTGRWPLRLRSGELTVVVNAVSVIKIVCAAGHRCAACACQQPDCMGCTG